MRARVDLMPLGDVVYVCARSRMDKLLVLASGVTVFEVICLTYGVFTLWSYPILSFFRAIRVRLSFLP